MSTPVERVEAEALQLSIGDRARLAHKLLESLDEAEVEDPEEVERAWKAEIERRLADLDAGRVELVLAEDVMREARRIVGQK